MRPINWKLGNFLGYVLSMQIAMYLVLAFNLPIARQVIGFLYLTFVPGIIILRLLKLQNLDWTEFILFSVGLSLAFLMITGLLINELSPLTGLSAPLSEIPLIAVISSVTISLSFWSFLSSNKYHFLAIRSLKLNPLVLLFVCLPLISIFGAIAVNAFGNNSILLLMIIAVSVLVVLITFFEKLFPPKFYPVALFCIGLALLFHVSLISNYVNGQDIHVEYYVFKLTRDNSHWSSTFSVPYFQEYGRFNSMLSITILPTIYSVFTNLDETWTLKVFYPLIFALVPLGLYKLFQMRVNRKTAFLSTFFFMSFNIFFTEMLGLARQMVAELFFVLLFFVIFNKKMNYTNKMVCLMIFGVGLALSHYALSYVFMFLIFFTWLSSIFLKTSTQSIKLSTVVLFFIITFSWYMYVSAAEPFEAILSMGNSIFRTLTVDLLNPSSRGTLVLRGVGLESPQSVWHLIGRIFAYATQFFIVVGFISLLTNRKKASDKEYVVILSLNMVLLIMSIVLPSFALSLQMTRLYHILLLFLAPLCIQGVTALLRHTLKLKSELPALALILIILIPFFLFQTNFAYEVTGDDSWSQALSGYRMARTRLYYLGFLNQQDVFGAEWLTRNINTHTNSTTERESVYADLSRNTVLTSYGMISRNMTTEISNNPSVSVNGIIFLSSVNVIDGKVFGTRTGLMYVWNTTEISSALENINKIYSNGASEIYQNRTAP